MEETEYTLGRQIAVAARLWRTELDSRLQSLDLSQARFVLLVHLTEAGGPIPQNDLAERAGISGPTLVRHIDLLQNHGLVKRQDAPSDRRVKHVCLTKVGRQRCEAAKDIAEQLRAELVSPFPKEVLNQSQSMLKNLVNSLETMRNGASADD